MDSENTNIVTGEDIEPDESRTPTEFAQDELLTIEQVAKHLNTSATRVREWIASGMLTAEPSGSVERIRRSELNKIGDPEAGAAKEFEKDHKN